MRLGRRQLDVMQAAINGKCYTHHGGQGRFWVNGMDITSNYGDDVLDRMLELGLIRLVDDGRTVSGFKVVLTAKGTAEWDLRMARDRERAATE